MSQFRDSYGEFRRFEVEVAAVSVDSPYCHLAFARELDIRFPLVSDFNRELLRAYDVLSAGTPLLWDIARRSAFVIDATGLIRYVWTEKEGLPPIDPILDAVRAVTVE